MAVHASQKRETRVDYLNKIQDFLVEVNNFIKEQENYSNDLILKYFLDMIIKAYINATDASYIKIINIETYHERLKFNLRARALFKTIVDYLEIVWASHSETLGEKQFIRWCNLIGEVNTKIKKNNEKDLAILKRLLGKKIQDSEITKLMINFEKQVYESDVTC